MVRKLIILLLFPTICQAADYEQILNATCRVNGGSGVLIKKDKEYAWIMTAGHCVVNREKKKNPGEIYDLKESQIVRFYNEGQISHKMQGEVHWFIYHPKTTSDLAIVKVSQSEFLDYSIPDPLKIAPKYYELEYDETITSCGCPNAAWPNLWKGRVSRISSDYFLFKPRPVKGRSGSAVFNKQGEIVGIVILTDGTAVPLDRIYHLAGKYISKR